MKFYIKLAEERSATVGVEADDIEKAMTKAKNAFESGDIQLESDDMYFYNVSEYFRDEKSTSELQKL